MMSTWNFINGYKSYLAAITGGIIGILWHAGYIDDDMAKTLEGICGVAFAMAMRHAVQKSGPPSDEGK